MITKISYVKTKADFKNAIFVYGNCDFYKSSFVNFIAHLFKDEFEVVKPFSVAEINDSVETGLFGPSKGKLFILEPVDKDLEKIYEKIDFRTTKNRFVFIDTDFRKTKKISADFTKSSNVQCIAFFENNLRDYLMFLTNFFRFRLPVDLDLVAEDLVTRREDPFKFFQKISMLDDPKDAADFVMKSDGNMNDMEPIGMLRFMLASLKFSSDFKMLPKNPSRVIDKVDATRKILDLEVFYKKNNLRSKIFIGKEFL